MRMINTTTIKLNDDWKPLEYFMNGNGYAILSHRWQGSEISFQDMRSGILLSTPAFTKILKACEKAKSLGHDWLWVDTCCINKDSDAELVESINSMFRWYLRATVCLAYLYDVGKDNLREPEAARKLSVFRRRGSETGEASEWFNRGWTLQELLAPKNVSFYDMSWNELGSKNDLAQQISEITGVDEKYLIFERESLSTACIATKMSWMASRKTTREEDMAYSLVGLFNVSILVRYGESGTSAFVKLQEELLKKFPDDSLFAWRMPQAGVGLALLGWGPEEWGLLAAEPSWFKDSGRFTISLPDKSYARAVANGFAATQNGVQIPGMPLEIRRRFLWPAVPTMVGLGILVYYVRQANRNTTLVLLNCWDNDTGEQIALHLIPANGHGEMKRSRCREFAQPPRYRLRKRVPLRKESVYATLTHRMVLQPEERYD